MGLLQGVLGNNLSEVSIESLEKEFGMYLMTGEKIQVGFKLVRDSVVITDKRILEFDYQGATGKKCRVESINLGSIFNVSAETAGFGIDDSELEIWYVTTPYLKAPNVEFKHKKFEFPKKYEVRDLYRMLQELAYNNFQNLNK